VELVIWPMKRQTVPAYKGRARLRERGGGARELAWRKCPNASDKRWAENAEAGSITIMKENQRCCCMKCAATSINHHYLRARTLDINNRHRTSALQEIAY
jgi:hypothetical protein